MNEFNFVITDADSRVAYYCAVAIRRARPRATISGVASGWAPKLGVYDRIEQGPAQHGSPTQWVRFLNEKFDSNAVVMPMSTASYLALLQVRSDLHAQLATAPDLHTFRSVSDKWQLHQICQAKWPGLMPETFLCSSLRQIEEAASTLKFPLVLKLRREEFHVPESRYRIVRCASMLMECHRSLGAGEVIAQKYVVGESIGVGLLANQNGVECFAHRRLRTEVASGGPSTYCEAVAAQDAEQIARLLVGALGYKGLAMIEFIRDTSGGLHLLEINPRPWGSIQLPIASGVNFPLMWVEESAGQRRILDARVASRVRRLKYVRLDIRAWRSQRSSEHRLRQLLQYAREYFDPSCALYYSRHDFYRSLVHAFNRC